MKPFLLANMKIIFTSNGHEIFVDDEDYEILNSYKWNVDKRGYAARADYINKKVIAIRMHRQVLGLVKGDGVHVDHKNMNKSDNQKLNLRMADAKTNSWNSGMKKKNTSGFKGVDFSKTKKKWQARIRVGGERLHLGFYEKPDDAFFEYCCAAIKHHGEFANLN